MSKREKNSFPHKVFILERNIEKDGMEEKENMCSVLNKVRKSPQKNQDLSRLKGSEKSVM